MAGVNRAPVLFPVQVCRLDLMFSAQSLGIGWYADKAEPNVLQSGNFIFSQMEETEVHGTDY